MNNLLRDIIQQEILSMNTDRTGLLERIIREELLAEQTTISPVLMVSRSGGLPGKGWTHTLLSQYLGDSDVRNPRVAVTHQQAVKNGATLGLVIISSRRGGDKSANIMQLRSNVQQLINDDTSGIGFNQAYNKEKFIYVLSNPVKRMFGSYKWHLWIISKYYINKLVNDIKNKINDPSVYKILSNFDDWITEATYVTPEQGHGWIENLKKIAQKHNIQIPIQVNNINISKINKNVTLGQPDKYVETFKNFEGTINKHINGGAFKNGTAVVEYDIEAMGYKIVPIQGEMILESGAPALSYKFKGKFKSGIPSEGTIKWIPDESKDVNEWSEFVGTLQGTGKKTPIGPTFNLRFVKGTIKYINKETREFTKTFTGTFKDGDPRYPDKGKYTSNDFTGEYENGEPMKGTWTYEDGSTFKGIGPWDTRKGVYIVNKTGNVYEGQWKDDKFYSVTLTNALGVVIGKMEKGKGAGTGNPQEYKQDDSGPAVEKLKQMILDFVINDDNKIPSGAQDEYQESIQSNPDKIDEITFKLIGAIKEINFNFTDISGIATKEFIERLYSETR